MNVGIIIHPIDIVAVRNNYRSFYPVVGFLLAPFVGTLSDYKLKEMINKLSPHQFMKLKVNDKLRITGIMVPMFPIDMVRDKAKALSQIDKALRIAKGLEVDIVTLAAFTSIVSRGGDDIDNTYSVSYTSGNALTAALCLEGVEKALGLLQKDLNASRVAIIGASGDIGSVCAQYFARKCNSLVLCSRSMSTSHEAYQAVLKLSSIQLEAVNEIDLAVKDADVVLSVASSFGAVFDEKNLKSGAIICDAGMPPNFAKNVRRQDIFAFDGGKAAVNFYDSIQSPSWKSLFPNNSIFGCFAEALTLALAEEIKCYSTGKGKLTLEKVSEIKGLASRMGVVLADFSYSGQMYKPSTIDDILMKVGS